MSRAAVVPGLAATLPVGYGFQGDPEKKTSSRVL